MYTVGGLHRESSTYCTPSSTVWKLSGHQTGRVGSGNAVFPFATPLVTRLSVERFPDWWLAAALTDMHLIGWKRYAVCGLRSWWFRWFLTVSREIEGAGPSVEKWREWLTRTAVERKHRTQSRRDRAGVRLDGVHNTPAPENWPIYTHQVSRSPQQLRLAGLFPRFKCVHEWRDITTGST